MKRRISGTRLVVSALSLAAMGWMLLPSTAKAQQALVIKLLIEWKVTELLAGPLFWRIENFPTIALAQAAKGPTGLVAESGGKVWLLTLATADGASPGGSKIAEVGPLPNVVCNEAREAANAVPPSDQRGERSSGQHNACAHASGLGGILRPRGRNQPKDPSRSGPYRSRSVHVRPQCRYADPSLKQWLDGPPRTRDVCGGRGETVFVAGARVSVKCPHDAIVWGSSQLAATEQKGAPSGWSEKK
jgi:hypothetical protein